MILLHKRVDLCQVESERVDWSGNLRQLGIQLIERVVHLDQGDCWFGLWRQCLDYRHLAVVVPERETILDLALIVLSSSDEWDIRQRHSADLLSHVASASQNHFRAEILQLSPEKEIPTTLPRVPLPVPYNFDADAAASSFLDSASRGQGSTSSLSC